MIRFTLTVLWVLAAVHVLKTVGAQSPAHWTIIAAVFLAGCWKLGRVGPQPLLPLVRRLQIRQLERALPIAAARQRLAVKIGDPDMIRDRAQRVINLRRRIDRLRADLEQKQ